MSAKYECKKYLVVAKDIVSLKAFQKGRFRGRWAKGPFLDQLSTYLDKIVFNEKGDILLCESVLSVQKQKIPVFKPRENKLPGIFKNCTVLGGDVLKWPSLGQISTDKIGFK